MRKPCPECGVSIPATATACTRVHAGDYRVTLLARDGHGPSFVFTEDRERAIETASEYLASLSEELRNVSDFWGDALGIVVGAEENRPPGGIGSALLISGAAGVAVEHRRYVQPEPRSLDDLPRREAV